MRGAFRRLRRPLSVTAAAPRKHLFDVCCCKTEDGDWERLFFLVFVSDVVQLFWTWTSVSFCVRKKEKKKRKNSIGEITFPPPSTDVALLDGQ